MRNARYDKYDLFTRKMFSRQLDFTCADTLATVVPFLKSAKEHGLRCHRSFHWSLSTSASGDKQPKFALTLTDSPDHCGNFVVEL